jgi:hypothetical protein
MTSQSPRIYVYKITFQEVLHYYYGVHKEKRFDEYYMGSPVTHKDFWELYTPKKEYIEFFEFSDEGYTEARIFEDSLIAPVLNDEFCLNEHVGGFYSLESCRKAGQIGGNKNKKNKTGIFGMTPEERRENSRKAGNKAKENKTGVCGRSPEKMSEDGKKGGKIGGKIVGNRHKENKTGIFGRSPEKMSEDGRKAGNKTKENKTGIFGRSPEKMSEDSRKSGNKHKENKTGVCGLSLEERSEAGKKGGKASTSKKWQCTETGYTSTAGGLARYQNKRGIDWEITFEDGRVIVTYQTIKDWAEENGYSYSSLLHVRGGKVKNHKGIIKVVSF